MPEPTEPRKCEECKTPLPANAPSQATLCPGCAYAHMRPRAQGVFKGPRRRAKERSRRNG
jgi:hypothetical protein